MSLQNEACVAADSARAKPCVELSEELTGMGNSSVPVNCLQQGDCCIVVLEQICAVSQLSVGLFCLFVGVLLCFKPQSEFTRNTVEKVIFHSLLTFSFLCCSHFSVAGSCFNGQQPVLLTDKIALNPASAVELLSWFFFPGDVNRMLPGLCYWHGKLNKQAARMITPV